MVFGLAPVLVKTEAGLSFPADAFGLAALRDRKLD